MDTALDLHERLPALGAALDKGVLDLRRARTINMGTSHVDQATARMVTDRILDTAAKSITGQIAARLRKLCITINPDNARSEYHTGLDDRRLWTEMNPDGTANLHGYNLAPLCRHDHQLKHDRWALTRQPNGDHTWTSPPGHT